MRDYLRLFKQIVAIMHQDYAGKDEKEGHDDPSSFRSMIKTRLEDNSLDDFAFHTLVFDYLLAFDDLHILWRGTRGRRGKSSKLIKYFYQITPRLLIVFMKTLLFDIIIR